MQETEAKKLHEEVGVPENDFGSTLADAQIFTEHLQVEINIVDADQFNEVIYSAASEYCDKQIYLLKNQNHFDVITSMPGFLCKDYYCHTCKKHIKPEINTDAQRNA